MFKSYLKEISEKIKSFSNVKNLENINIPLLGFENNYVNSNEVINVFRSIFDRDSSGVYKIFCSSEKEYYEMTLGKKVNVFISYAKHDENTKWVNQLARNLEDRNIKVNYFEELAPGSHMPNWMHEHISKDDYVLIICEQYYKEKAEGFKDGVGQETNMILTQMNYYQDIENNKFVVICRDDNVDFIPDYLKNYKALLWGQKKNINKKQLDELISFLKK